MTGFFVLFRTMIRHYFGLSVIREVYIKRKQELWKPILVLLAIPVSLAPILYAYVRFLNSVYFVSAQLHQPGLVIAFGLVAAQLVVLIFGLFYLISVFYFSADMEHLVPLPIKPETILAAKFGMVLIGEYVTALPMAVPAVVIYGLNQSVGIFYWLKSAFVILLLPVLPLTLASILVIGMMRTTGLARNRERFTVLFGVLVLALVLVMQWHLGRTGDDFLDPSQILNELIDNPNSLINLLSRRFPPARWASLALSDQGITSVIHLLFYLGSTLIGLALLQRLARLFFYDSLLHHTSAKKRRHRLGDLSGHLRARSPLTALIHREWQLLSRNPVFAMNAAANIFLPPLFIALPVLAGGEQFAALRLVLSTPPFALWVTLGIAAFFALSAPMSAIPTSAVSREGRLFWISRSIPATPQQQLLAKMIFSVGLLSASSSLIVLVAAFIFRLPLTLVLTGWALGFLGLLSTCAISLTVDALWPLLDWDNPQQAMKGNLNVLVALLAIALLGFALSQPIISWVKKGWSAQTVLSSTAFMLAVLATVSIRLLLSVGPKSYTQQSLRPKSRRRPLNPRAVLSIALVLVGAVFLGRELFMMATFDYTFEAEQLRFGPVRLSYDEIIEVQYLERIPPLSNRVGTSLGAYKSGTFTVAGIGRGKVFATDSTKPALLLRTEDTFYIITPENAYERFLELSERIE
ncbi:MAG: hypothetical protein GX162_02755 [Firmicutes bacterium]|jgi:ABC-2 type transport system permease protein|nr:hypothetical protein [Bacillota bacterium]